MSRPSAVFRSSTFNTPSSIRSSGKLTSLNVPTNDPFPLLDIKEIVICLESCSFTCSEELLLKPTQHYMLTLFQQILDAFLNISDKKFFKVINNIDDNNEYTETLNLVGLQKIIYKFLNECGIDDFNILDIIKPEPQRIRRILSCVVNFARFREEHKYILEELQLKNDELVHIYKQLNNKVNTLQLDIKEMTLSNQLLNLQQINELNTNLENELRKLKKKQEAITAEHDSYKRDKISLLKQYEDVSYLLVESQKEFDKLKLITNESPELVLQFNKDLSLNLEKEQENFNYLELRSRNLSISIESFNLLEQEFKNFLKVLQELQGEIGKEEATKSKLGKYRELFDSKQYQLQEIERKLKLTNRQIENSESKMERLNQTSDEKRKKLSNMLQEVHNKYATLITERDLNEQDLLSKKKQISNLENKINELKLQYESETKELNHEIMKLNSHIKMYLSEMAKKM